MIFVDTSVWFAAAIEEDPDHHACRNCLNENASRLMTTDHVVSELLTLMSARGYRHRAARIGSGFWSETTAPITWVTRADTETAWRVFQQFADKRWSFTDCTSYAVMQRLGITEAFSLDDHFRQFGFAEVRP